MITKQVSGGKPITYTYGVTQPHAVTSVTIGYYEAAQAAYDCNGNLTSRMENYVTYQQAWDAENRLVVVTNTSTTPNRIGKFIYDGDGNRVLQVQINSTQIITTVYAGAIEVQITATQRITKSYYSAGSQLIALRVYTASNNSVLYFLHGDHLGSISLTTNASGGFVARQLYDAWGNVRYISGTLPTDVTFTGQRSNSYINLAQMGARW